MTLKKVAYQPGSRVRWAEHGQAAYGIVLKVFTHYLERTMNGATVTRPANRRNPDPNMWAGFGERSVDDMLQVWLNIVYLDEGEYKRLVDERKAALSAFDDQSDRGEPTTLASARSEIDACTNAADINARVAALMPLLDDADAAELREYGLEAIDKLGDGQ